MRVVACDDHTMFLDAFSWALARRNHDVVGTASELHEVAPLVDKARPEACLLDLWFGGVQSLDVARSLRERHPELLIVLLTGDAAPEALAALDDGTVHAVAHKTWNLELIDETLTRVASGVAVRRLLAMPREREPAGTRPAAPTGQTPALTSREHEVLELMASGASTTEIRRQLGVTEHTVRSHVRNVLAKLGAHTRVEAVHRALEVGLACGAGR
ncbi:MAG: response regulator transcription factor [Nocardioides sp.]|nr:response regulator transcription factor [Nocardioides sp.]